jgi:SpoVK/Ycf46/Vps4 family AAA+-type ATPase
MSSGSFPKHLAGQVVDFAGRQWVLDNVAEWVGDLGAPRVLLITGEPGCGKTALSAWLAAPSDALPAGRLKDVRSIWTARHFCMAEEHGGTLQPARFAQLLAQQIGERIPNSRHNSQARSRAAECRDDRSVFQDRDTGGHNC